MVCPPYHTPNNHLETYSPVKNHGAMVLEGDSRWDPRDELALLLDDVECDAFGVSHDSHSKYMLNSDGIAPTALHARGSQLPACACGCRAFPLSAKRLQEKGLYGLLVHSYVTSFRLDPFDTGIRMRPLP